jgi:hypothetical protein
MFLYFYVCHHTAGHLPVRFDPLATRQPAEQHEDTYTCCQYSTVMRKHSSAAKPHTSNNQYAANYPTQATCCPIVATSSSSGGGSQLMQAELKSPTAGPHSLPRLHYEDVRHICCPTPLETHIIRTTCTCVCGIRATCEVCVALPMHSVHHHDAQFATIKDLMWWQPAQISVLSIDCLLP